jgi:PAS domain S-box-containing protein
MSEEIDMDTHSVSQYQNMNTSSDIIQKMKHQKGESAAQLAKEIASKNIANETINEKDDRFLFQFYLFPLPTYIWKIIDDDMILIDINEAALKFSGPKIQDLLGHKASDIYFDVPHILEWMNQCRRELHGVRKQFYLSLRTTGERKYLDASWVFFPPGYILFHVSDITDQKIEQTKLEESVKMSRQEIERSNANLQSLNKILEKEIQSHKQTENLLKSEQEKFYSLLENLPAIVFLIHPDQTISYANQYFTKYIGDNTSSYCFEIMPCVSDQCDDCVMKKVIETGQQQTKEWITKSGDCFAMHYYPFQKGKDESAVLGLGIDITDRKHMEEQLRQARQTAEQSSIFKSQFLARMSHEIRTPMNGVLGMTDLLLKTAVSEEQKEYLHTLKNSGEMLLTIINDILDISKIEAGKLELHMRPFDLTSLLEDVYHLLLPKAQEKNICFSYQIPDEMHRVYESDPIRIRQILFNLIGNAIKFTDDGAVEIIVQQTKTESENVGILFEIKDTGPGIPKDQQEYIFHNFTQVNVSQQNYQGTGLGLSISYHLARLLKGKIWLESQLNKGASFFLYLELPESDPLLLEKNEKPQVQSISHTKDISKLKILLVEDNPSNRKVFTYYMNKLGYPFDYAVNGLEAINRVNKQDYNIILMDIMMPKMDGIKATRRIREILDEDRQPVIIALTADALVGKRKDYLQSGFDDYCTKPFNLEKLKQIFDTHLFEKDSSEQAFSSQESNVQSSFDLDQFQELKNELKDNYDELIQLALKESPTLFESLQRAVEEMDFIKIKEYAHAMKSIINIFGSSRLSMQCNKMGAAVTEQSEKNVQKVFKILEKDYHEFRGFLEKQLKEVC